MIARPLDRLGMCVCGVAVALHFDAANRRVSCEEARALLTAAAAAVLDAFPPIAEPHIVPAKVLSFPSRPSTASLPGVVR